MSKCSADETPVCCCMDVGTIMDNPTFTDVDGGVQLDIDFVFSCEAESLIFQLGLR